MAEENYQDISRRVDNIEKLVNQIDKGQKEGFRKLFHEIESLKKDNSLTIDGDSRHNVKPVRDVAEEGVKIGNRAHQRIDHILWLVAGISMGCGIGGALAIRLLFGL